METITSESSFHPNRTFEVVDSVPSGYMIWNIGKNMVDGYLPLCRLSACQPFPGGRNIEVDTLKAIKCDGAQIILAAAGYGPKTVSEMEKHIEKYFASRPHECNKMRAALPFMRNIKGL